MDGEDFAHSQMMENDLPFLDYIDTWDWDSQKGLSDTVWVSLIVSVTIVIVVGFCCCILVVKGRFKRCRRRDELKFQVGTRLGQLQPGQASWDLETLENNFNIEIANRIITN